ncbi:MAG: hypothetical protein ACOYOO_09920, partial [Saprospiraceae bacterium]
MYKKYKTGGTSFTKSGAFSSNVFDVYVKNGVGITPDTILAGTASGLQVSVNGGETYTAYTQVTDGLGSNTVQSVFIDSDGNWYAGTTGGLSISYDGGVNWTNLTTANGLPSNAIKDVYVGAVGNTPLNKFDAILVGTPSGFAIGMAGVMDMQTGNEQFVSFNTGLTNTSINHILPISPSVAANLLVSTSGGGIGVSTLSAVAEGAAMSSLSVTANFANAQKGYFAAMTSGSDTCFVTHLVRIPDIPPAITTWADSTRGPSTCDGSTFGQLGIEGMIPGEQYFLRYTIGGVTKGGIPSSNSTITADSNGRLLVQLIDSIGTYEVRIASLDTLAGQTDTCWAITNITISAPTAPADPVEGSGSIVNICANNENVRIDLNPAGMGSWTSEDIVLAFANAGLTIAAPTDTAAAADIYSPNVAPTGSGSYWFIVRNSTTRCLSDT